MHDFLDHFLDDEHAAQQLGQHGNKGQIDVHGRGISEI